MARKGCIPWNKGESWFKEMREKLSRSHGGIQEGIKNPFYGKHHTEETKEKIRNSEYHKNAKGENHPFWGKHHTEETKRKMSENHANFKKENHPIWGKHLSDQTKKKLSEKLKGKIPWNRGIPQTEETRKKISARLKGHKDSLETRKKKSLARMGDKNPFYGKRVPSTHRENLQKGCRRFWLGNHHLEETKRKISEGNKGKICLEETKKKISKSLVKYYKNHEIHWSKFNKRPTGLEKNIIEMDIPALEYTGNGKFWITILNKHLNPDFKVYEQKKVIEAWGYYWHKGQNPEDRINLYKKAGFQCLVLWEYEIKKSQINCKQKIQNFMNQKDDMQK